MRRCTVVVIVPITQLGSSSSLSWHCSVYLLSPSFPSSPSLKLARSLRLSPIITIIFWKAFLGSLFINLAFSVFVVSSFSCWTAAYASSTRCLAPAVPLPISSSIDFSWSSLLKQCDSRRFSAARFILDRKRRNSLRAPNLSDSKQLLLSFTWWCHWVDHFIDVPYLCARRGEKFFFKALTIIVLVEFVVGQDVGCCKIWTIWSQAASCRTRLVCLIILNKAKSPFWMSIKWE